MLRFVSVGMCAESTQCFMWKSMLGTLVKLRFSLDIPTAAGFNFPKTTSM